MEEELKRKIAEIEKELEVLKKSNEIADEILETEKIKSQLLKEQKKQLFNELLEQLEINKYYKNKLNEEEC